VGREQSFNTAACFMLPGGAVGDDGPGHCPMAGYLHNPLHYQ